MSVRQMNGLAMLMMVAVVSYYTTVFYLHVENRIGNLTTLFLVTLPPMLLGLALVLAP